MATSHEIEPLLTSLSRGEGTTLDSKHGVCGGVPCIVRTRIAVWLLEQMHRAGVEQQLLEDYPALRAEA